MKTHQTPAQTLGHMLTQSGIIVAPGIYDHMSLLMAREAGFKAFYASGYWNAASALGEPDVGIAGASDFLAIFSRFVEKAAAPIIADADTGFGSLTNLDRAVKAYQRAGIAAIQLEDQGFPKICGHVGKASSVSAQEMVKRVEVAVEARAEGDMRIIARTDARRTEGLEAAIGRLQEYDHAGADILFLEGPQSEEEIAQAADALQKPLDLPGWRPAQCGSCGPQFLSRARCRRSQQRPFRPVRLLGNVAPVGHGRCNGISEAARGALMQQLIEFVLTIGA
jgi:2-methylisocitrate lyase-like PEP mutase family enzyme